MATFEQLVPPFELCQQIPKDAFNDTALVWWFSGKNYWVLKRDDPVFVRWPSWILAPAPTAQELLEAMHFSCSVVKREHFEWDGVTRYYCTAVANAKGTEFLRCDVNLPKTLLKLWMDIRRECTDREVDK